MARNQLSRRERALSATVARLLRERTERRTAAQREAVRIERIGQGNTWVPNRILHVAGIVAVNPGVTSPGYRIDWPASGIVCSMTGSVDTGNPADLATMGVRIQRDGMHDIISTGLTQAFAPMADLFPNASPRFPIQIRVSKSDVWFATFVNNNPNVVVPSLSLFLALDVDAPIQ